MSEKLLQQVKEIRRNNFKFLSKEKNTDTAYKLAVSSFNTLELPMPKDLSSQHIEFVRLIDSADETFVILTVYVRNNDGNCNIYMSTKDETDGTWTLSHTKI